MMRSTALDQLRNRVPSEKRGTIDDALSAHPTLSGSACSICMCFPEQGKRYASWGCDCSIAVCMDCALDLVNRAHVPSLAKCPQCRAPPLLRADGTFPENAHMMGILEQHKIACPFHDPEGCEFQGTVIDLKAHLDVCEHMPVKCPMHPQGCNWVGKQCDLHAHMTSVQHGQYLVPFCAQQMKSINDLTTSVHTLSGLVTTLTTKLGSVESNQNQLKRDHTTFSSSMRAYMGANGKKVKHASPYGPDSQCERSQLNARFRQRVWWARAEDDEAGWNAMRLRRQRLPAGQQEMEPPRGWKKQTDARRATPLPPLGVGAAAAADAETDDDDWRGDAAVVDDDDDDDDDA
jgi:hypothetical protein